MRRLFRAFSALLRAAVAVMLQYRGEIFLWAVWGIINPAVLYAVWSAAASGQADGMIAGYDRGQLAAYYIAIMVVGHLATAWDAHELGYLIRSGQLSPKLLRPLLPLWEALATNLSYKIATFPIVLPLWLVFALIVQPEVDPTAWQIALGVVAGVLGSLINFFLGYLIALVAFWSPKLDAVGEVYFGVSVFFGGRFSPLAALPSVVLLPALYMPFRWIYAFPAELLIGKVADPSTALVGIGAQVAWLAGTAVAFRFAWQAAVRRYTAVSG